MRRETDSATLPLGAVLREGGRSDGTQHGIRVEPTAIRARSAIPANLVGESRGAMREANRADQPAKDYRLMISRHREQKQNRENQKQHNREESRQWPGTPRPAMRAIAGFSAHVPAAFFTFSQGHLTSPSLRNA